MALIAFGNQLVKDLEKSGALGVYAPLEGGFEGRYQRRLRAAGYTSLRISARGLGDLSAYLMEIHGVRPAHVGKKEIRTYYVPPVIGYQLDQLPTHSKGFVLWVIEGYMLSRQELEYLADLPKQDSRIKIVVEMGGDRSFRWTSLEESIKAA